MTDKIHELLDFWFGDLGVADLPTSNRTSLWFGDNEELKIQMYDLFNKEFIKAQQGKLNKWMVTPRGRLAIILLLDQFPRYLNKRNPKAFEYDIPALNLSLQGLEEKVDQSLTLIERVFFYMPLVHSENADIQERSIRLYQSLVTLSMTETTQVYQLFLAYAYAHFRVIKEFGRFPQRNQILGRESTQAELVFLKNT